MEGSKLYSLLETRSIYELNRFKKFIESPYHNENKRNIAVYHHLLLIFKAKGRFPKMETVWKKAFPKEKFDQVRSRRIASDITLLLYKFFSIEWYNHSSGMQGLEGALLKTNHPMLGKHHTTVLKKMRSALEKGGWKNGEHHRYQYLLEYESHIHLNKTAVKGHSLENLAKADRHLDIYYLANKLRHHCDVLNYKTYLSLEIELGLMEQVYQSVNEKGLINEPVISIYWTVSKTLTESENAKHYFSLVGLLEEHHLIFPVQELRTLYVYATNYCISKINSGDKDFYRELFDLYFILLERKTIFNDEDELDERHYKNIITLGLRLKEFDKVENFIREYSNVLRPDIRENALTYNLAQLYYAKAEYDKAIEQLSFLDYKDVFYALGGRVLLLKTYYELEEHDPLENHIDSFRIYLRRNKLISGDVKKQYLNFLKYSKSLISLPYGKSKKWESLKSAIEANQNLVNRNWLMEKLENLKR